MPSRIAHSVLADHATLEQRIENQRFRSCAPGGRAIRCLQFIEVRRTALLNFADQVDIALAISTIGAAHSPA